MLYAEKEYRIIFNDADKDNDGFITFKDLLRIVQQVDHMFPEQILKKCFDDAKIRIPPADKMDYPEFIEAMGKINFYYKTHRSSWDTGKGPILVGQLTSKFQHYLNSPRFIRQWYIDFFYETDTDNDGFITFDEFLIISRKYQLEYLERTIRLEFNKHNTRGDGYMDLNEFLIAMGFGPATSLEIKKRVVIKQTEVKKAPPPVKAPKFALGASLLRQIFMSMDQDGDGVLNKFEIQKALRQLGQDLTLREVAEIIEAYDGRGDGQLNFEEFKEYAMAS